MSTQTLNISLPEELVCRVDEQSKKDYSSRSDFIRKAVVNQLRTEQGLADVLDNANKKGKKLGFTSEQAVYDHIES